LQPSRSWTTRQYPGRRRSETSLDLRLHKASGFGCSDVVKASGGCADVVGRQGPPMSGEIRLAESRLRHRDRVGEFAAQAWEMIWSGGYLWAVAIIVVFSLTFSVTVLSVTAVGLGKSSFVTMKAKAFTTKEKAKNSERGASIASGSPLAPSSPTLGLPNTFAASSATSP
jgi:hypothetical protein